MIWFILAGLVTIGYIIYAIIDAYKYGFNAQDNILYPILFSLGSLFVAVVLFLGSTAICSLFAKVEYDTLVETKEITALNDDSAISGHFYLGSGYVNEKKRYYFFEETDKGKHMDSVDADSSYIIESDTEQPRIEVYPPKFKSKWLYLFAMEFADTEYKIYIPENSITTEFKVDLE